MSPREIRKSKVPRTHEWNLIWKWGLCRQNALKRKPVRWDLIQMTQGHGRTGTRPRARGTAWMPKIAGSHPSSGDARTMVPGSGC